MARKRLVSPEFFQHGSLFDAEQASGLPLRLAFAGLWCQADREGRFRVRPRELKLGVLPYDQLDFSKVLDALQTFGFIRCYVVEGEAFAYIPSFKKWQTFHLKEVGSTIPAPCETGASTVPAPCEHGASTPGTGTGTVSSTVTSRPPTTPPSAVRALPAVTQLLGGGGVARADFLLAWAEYPKRPGNSKADALKAWSARIKEGCDPAAMLDGVRRYAAFVTASGTEPRFVKMAATFFGPGKHFEADYSFLPAPDEFTKLAAEAADLSGYVA